MRQKSDKRFSPCSEEKKRKISESLTDKHLGGYDFVVRPEDGAELRRITAEGGRFVHQDLIDQWRTMKW